MNRILVLLSFLIGLACAPPRTVAPPPRNLFLLMPDRENHVGGVTITNAKGSANLDQANQGVLVAAADAAPGVSWILSPAEIQADFGAALAAEPPASFVCQLQFRTRSSQLEPETVAALVRVLTEIHQRDSREILVTGHTDTTGDTEYNMKLSLERAEKVRSYLIQNGVNPRFLSVAYHGKGEPLVPTGDHVDEPRNRRVQVIVR
jgi:outer membrane protein OmpA-like peptidoglycan-associated protein